MENESWILIGVTTFCEEQIIILSGTSTSLSLSSLALSSSSSASSNCAVVSFEWNGAAKGSNYHRMKIKIQKEKYLDLFPTQMRCGFVSLPQIQATSPSRRRHRNGTGKTDVNLTWGSNTEKRSFKILARFLRESRGSERMDIYMVGHFFSRGAREKRTIINLPHPNVQHHTHEKMFLICLVLFSLCFMSFVGFLFFK
jgi:hypothetical protein